MNHRKKNKFTQELKKLRYKQDLAKRFIKHKQKKLSEMEERYARLEDNETFFRESINAIIKDKSIINSRPEDTIQSLHDNIKNLLQIKNDKDLDIEPSTSESLGNVIGYLSEYDNQIAIESTNPTLNKSARKKFNCRKNELKDLYASLRDCIKLDLVQKSISQAEKVPLLLIDLLSDGISSEQSDIFSKKHSVLFVGVECKLNAKNFETLIEFNKIKLNKIAFKSSKDDLSYTFLQFFTKHAIKCYNDNPSYVEEMFDLFERKGVNYNAPCLSGYSPLTMAILEHRLNNGSILNPSFITSLLKHGANPNISIYNNEGFPISLFSLALCTGRVEIITALLEGGAIPSFSNIEKAFDEYNVGLDYLLKGVKKLPINNYTKNSLVDFLKIIYPQIEEFLLESIYRASNNAKQDVEAICDNQVSDNESNIEQKSADTWSVNNIESSDLKKSPDPVILNPKAIEQYIEFKKSTEKLGTNLSEDAHLKNKFDILLLKSDIDGARDLLEDNPQLYGYSMTRLLDIPNEDAAGILAYNQKMLDEFFKLKKQNSLIKKQSDNIDIFASGVYEIDTKYDTKYYIKISDDVFKALNLDSNSKLEKLEFISPSSTGKNGIKVYKDGSCATLKLGSSDNTAICTKILSLQKSNIQIMIFDGFGNHESRKHKNIVYQEITKEECNNVLYFSNDVLENSNITEYFYNPNDPYTKELAGDILPDEY